MSAGGFGEHVDSVRLLKRELKILQRDLRKALRAAELVKRAADLAVGPRREGEPESARLIRFWTEENINELNALIRGVDNTNEEADLYLRRLGG